MAKSGPKLLLLFSAFYVLVSIFCYPQYIPDSYEYGLMAQCFLGDSPSIDCTQAELAFRPPVAAIISGILFWMSPFLAIAIASITSIAASLCALVRIFGRLGDNVGMGAALSVLGAFVLFRYPLLADARIICVAPLLWAWVWALESNGKSRIIPLAAGLSMAMAALTRPECQLGIIGLLAYFAWAKRKSFILALIGTSVPIGLWIGLLSARAGRLVIGPRFWEDHLLELWTLAPKRMALQTYGMGIYSPPARLAAIDSPALSGSASAGADLSGGFQWIWMHAQTDAICWLIGFTFAIYIVFKKNDMREVVSAAMLMAAISLTAAFWPQARDPIFNESNMAILKLILWALCGSCCILIFNTYNQQRKPWITGVSLFIALFIPLASPATQAPKTIESQTHGIAAQQWIRKNVSQNETVTSSFETAPIVWLSHRKWKQRPSPWESPKAKYLLLSDLDTYWDPDSVVPLAFFAENESWVAIVRSEGSK